MSSKMHGKVFENVIKGANGIFRFAASDRDRSPTEDFDIGAGDDIVRGLPTSVKATGTGSVALSDARKFWRSFDHAPYRMIIGSHRPEGGRRVFREIHELILEERQRDVLFGDIGESEITAFHEGLLRFGLGEHEKARLWARDRKRELERRAGLLVLNPKIDSRRQRRLQCSVGLDDLVGAAGERILHTENFGYMALPFALVGGGRKR